MLSGVQSFSATPAGASTSSTIPTGSTLTPICSNLTSVTTLMAATHPLMQMLKTDQAAYDMQFINGFYVQVIEQILLIFKWSVLNNDAAYAIFIAFQEMPKSLLTIFNAISNRFLDVAQNVQLRISSFGTCTMINLDVERWTLWYRFWLISADFYFLLDVW